MEVRTAVRADAEGVRRVANAAWHEAHEPIVGEEAVAEFLSEYYDLETLRDRIEGTADRFFVAEDDQIVGFAAARAVDDEPGLYSLGNLYVHPDRWGDGIGSRLLDRVEAAVRDDGGRRIRLAVMAANHRAIGFYEAAGYEQIDEGYDERLDVERYTYAKDL